MSRSMDRRDFLRVGATAGALLVARPFGAWAQDAASPLGPKDHFGTSRRSRLFPGRFVVHSDLHNHTLLSDGVGAADEAFGMMRDAGLDVASLTDHAVMGKTHGDVTCMQPDPHTGCSFFVGINEDSWQRLAELADADNEPGTYVAMRGFEWTTNRLGHINVWLSSEWIDAMQTGSLTDLRDATELPALLGFPVPPELDAAVEQLPGTASIDGFWAWFGREPGTPVLGGGSDAVAGFNHPNSYGDFQGYQYFPEIADRVVSIEAHNGPTQEEGSARDYWFRGVDEGLGYPINRCLNAGWRVGLLGVSDNHTDTFGRPDAARGGLWVTELTREGVREALMARRMYSTVVPGLRLAATANGVPMGGSLPHDRGPVEFQLDLDRGADWIGKRLVVEVARPGADEPALVDAVEVVVSRGLSTFRLDLDRADGAWVLLRITDPEAPLADDAVAGTWTRHGGAIAYTSPWFLTEAGAEPAPSAPSGTDAAAGPDLPATGGGLAIGAAGAAATAALLARVGRDPGGA